MNLDPMYVKMINAAKAASSAGPMRKWVVRLGVNSTEKRRGVGGIGWSMGYVTRETTLTEPIYGSWIVNGWLKNNDASWWVRVAHLEEVQADEIPIPKPPAPPTGKALYRILHDWELKDNLKRDRPRRASGWPETVRLAHKTGSGNFKMDGGFIEYLLSFNPGMTAEVLGGILDKYNRQSEKWRDGNRKFPYELWFAGNTFAALRRFRNPGGLTGVKSGEWILEMDTLNPEIQKPAGEVGSEYRGYFTVAKAESRVVRPWYYADGMKTVIPLISPVPLYIQEKYVVKVADFASPFTFV